MLDTETREWQPPNWSPLHARGVSPAPSGALNVLARRWWVVLLIAVDIAAATYVVSRLIPGVYASSATVGVVISGTDPNSTTQGANNLASQYAQEVDAQPVLVAAARNLGDAARGLSGAISGGTVSGENLISIRATGSTPRVAQRRAAAVSSAFIRYVSAQFASQSRAFQAQSLRMLAPLDREIRHVTNELDTVGASQRTSPRYTALQATLSTLTAQRSAAVANIAQTAVGGRPSLTVVDAAGPGDEVAPKPALYAAVAFVLALVIAGRLVVYLGSRSRAR